MEATAPVEGTFKSQTEYIEAMYKVPKTDHYSTDREYRVCITTRSGQTGDQ